VSWMMGSSAMRLMAGSTLCQTPLGGTCTIRHHGQQQVLAQIHDPLLSSGFAIANREERVGEAGVPPDHDSHQEMEK
jgi:hypothetical protein